MGCKTFFGQLPDLCFVPFPVPFVRCTKFLFCTLIFHDTYYCLTLFMVNCGDVLKINFLYFSVLSSDLVLCHGEVRPLLRPRPDSLDAGAAPTFALGAGDSRRHQQQRRYLALHPAI
jgi:hypothetical protein